MQREISLLLDGSPTKYNPSPSQRIRQIPPPWIQTLNQSNLLLPSPLLDLFLPSNRRPCRRVRLIPNQFRHLIFLRESLAQSIFVNSNALPNRSSHAHINHARLARHNVDMKSPLHIHRFSHPPAKPPTSTAPSRRPFPPSAHPTTRHFERNMPTPHTQPVISNGMNRRFFFPIHSDESVGSWREKSLCSSIEALPTIVRRTCTSRFIPTCPCKGESVGLWKEKSLCSSIEA